MSWRGTSRGQTLSTDLNEDSCGLGKYHATGLVLFYSLRFGNMYEPVSLSVQDVLLHVLVYVSFQVMLRVSLNSAELSSRYSFHQIKRLHALSIVQGSELGSSQRMVHFLAC